MWSHEPAAEQKAAASAPPTRQRSSVAKLTTASSSLANLLSAFVSANNSSPDPRPPPPRRSFDERGAVGLGIVAAMGHGAEPIAIGAAARRRAREDDESYTCVIKHVAGAGGASVRKRVYFGFGDGGGGWLVEADDAAPTPAPDFLSRCCLCDKRLDGLDIYMYRCAPWPFIRLLDHVGSSYLLIIVSFRSKYGIDIVILFFIYIFIIHLNRMLYKSYF